MSIRARPYWSPSEPRVRPPTAQPIRKTEVVYEPYSSALDLSGSSWSIAAARPRLKNCWSMQSNNHASEAMVKTNQCSRVRSERQEGAEEAVDMGKVTGGAAAESGRSNDEKREAERERGLFQSFTGIPEAAEA